ncbi:hypothetical protein B0J14DRAFT_543155 [Halenospora varia]|nr:hypothetical protein B0J14DRAFT_543155 [Halenospora varia]
MDSPTYLLSPKRCLEERYPKPTSLTEHPPCSTSTSPLPSSRSTSTSSLTLDSPRSSSSSLQEKEDGNEKEKGKGKEEVITVGISGCSSSGKTTLAFLLNEIFNPLAHPRLTPGKIINQDAFFLPKAILPFHRFSCLPSSPAEQEFLEASLDKYEAEKGDWKRPMFGPHDGKGPLYEISRNDDGYRVRGPDSDCADAVDFCGLVESVKGVQTRNTTSALLMIKEGEEEARRKYRDLIHEQRLRVQELLRRGNFTPSQNDSESTPLRFIFLEGFLLLSPPPHSPMQLALTHREYESWFYMQHSWRIRGWREELTSLIQIPLFLPTSKEVAKARRFARNVYVDAHLGGGRHPGQMWKSEGYFERVAWEGYKREFGWLIQDDGVKGKEENEGKKLGVWIREKEDAGVEETVEWAVGVVLKELEGRGVNAM